MFTVHLKAITVTLDPALAVAFTLSEAVEAASPMHFTSDADEAIMQSLRANALHEWTVREFKAVCREH